MNEKLNQEGEQENNSKSKRNGRGYDVETAAARMVADPIQLPREILLQKKEISRLHYKVKRYHSQNRVAFIIANAIIIILLAVIAFQLRGFENRREENKKIGWSQPL